MKTCPFCGRDPYEYVDVGIGSIPVAVTCCEEGYMYFQLGMSKEEIIESLASRGLDTCGVLDDEYFSIEEHGFCDGCGCEFYLDPLANITSRYDNAVSVTLCHNCLKMALEVIESRIQQEESQDLHDW